MNAIARELFGRRLVGALLYAVLVTPIAMPVTVFLAGMIAGPPDLRAQIVITAGRFGAHHGRAGVFLVMLATVVGIALYRLAVGPAGRFAWNFGFAPALMDDGLSAREKIAAVLASGWGKLLLALLALWIAVTVIAP